MSANKSQTSRARSNTTIHSTNTLKDVIFWGKKNMKKKSKIRLCDRGSDNIAADTLLSASLSGLDGHTEVTLEHGWDIRDSNLEVITLDLIRLDGALTVLTKISLALFVGDLMKFTANIIVLAASNLTKARNLHPLGSTSLLLNGNISRGSSDIANNGNIERASKNRTTVDGHGGVELSLLDNNVVSRRITTVSDGEVDGVKSNKRGHLPWFKSTSTYGNNNKSSNDKSTHF